MPTVHSAPFAFTSDGTVLINVAELTSGSSFEALIAWIEGQKGPVFLGVVVTAPERKRALIRLDNAFADAAAHVGGARMRKTKR